jgi:hypothetical protein
MDSIMLVLARILHDTKRQSALLWTTKGSAEQ